MRYTVAIFTLKILKCRYIPVYSIFQFQAMFNSIIRYIIQNIFVSNIFAAYAPMIKIYNTL